MENEDGDAAQTPAPTASGSLRRSSRRTTVVAGGYRDDEDGGQQPLDVDDDDVDMSNGDHDGEAETGEGTGALPFDTGELITMDEDDEPITAIIAPAVKSEESEVQLIPPEQEHPTSENHRTPSPTPGDDASMPLEVDAEEKPKPILKLKYQGFNIHGRCICVIVEPYPPIRTAASRAVSLAPMGVIAPRAPSIAPADYVPPSVAAQRRARTPLFLPEDDRERSVTPAPWGPGGGQDERILPPVPLFNDLPGLDDEAQDPMESGMFELSQILQSVGGYPAGAAEDDDDIDGAALFGDADEVRGL